MFSEMLKFLREKRHLSQKEIAEYLGITRQAIALYELGKREPDYSILKKLADYFNVSVDYLLGGSLDKTCGNKIQNHCNQEDIALINNLNTVQLSDVSNKDEFFEWLGCKEAIEYVILARDVHNMGLTAEQFRKILDEVKLKAKNAQNFL